MKQQINFFTRLEPAKPVPKALLSICGVSALLVVGFVCFSAVLFMGNGELKTQLASAKVKEQSLKQEVLKRQAQDQRIDIAQLEKRLSNVRLQQQQQELLLKYLQDPAITNVTGFSDALTGLARQHVKGVSVQKFKLTHRGRRLEMAGKVDHPTFLPSYIERLGAEAVFARMSFEKLDISEHEGELDFEISSLTRPEGES